MTLNNSHKKIRAACQAARNNVVQIIFICEMHFLLTSILYHKSQSHVNKSASCIHNSCLRKICIQNAAYHLWRCTGLFNSLAAYKYLPYIQFLVQKHNIRPLAHRQAATAIKDADGTGRGFRSTPHRLLQRYLHLLHGIFQAQHQVGNRTGNSTICQCGKTALYLYCLASQGIIPVRQPAYCR